VSFDPIQTLSLAGLLLLAGYGLRARIAWLDRLNIPAPVIGGLAAALAVLAIKLSGAAPVKFDPAPSSPLMIAFFTSIGFSASFRLLKRGGPAVILLLALSAAVAVLQALLGAGVALAFGQRPLLGALIGTATLAGGPATGLAFAPQFEAAGIAGAGAVATATAMSGIVIAGLLGAPLATWLIEKRGLKPADGEAVPASPTAADPAAAQGVFTALKAIAVVVLCMALGARLSAAIQAAGITLPAYIGAMLVAAFLRNLDDLTGWVGLPHAAIELGGAVALSLFLVLAMMGLDLSLLAGLAAPLVVNLVLQTALVAALVVGPVWWLMGRDYDSAVTGGGFAGFMLGTTANAMAVMRSLVEKYGAAPRAFLAVPLVGAFFIDFTNALILTAALNLG
jgi:ESS family glutamate:Na+ symporter